jgi:hypothetical protein
MTDQSLRVLDLLARIFPIVGREQIQIGEIRAGSGGE